MMLCRRPGRSSRGGSRRAPRLDPLPIVIVLLGMLTGGWYAGSTGYDGAPPATTPVSGTPAVAVLETRVAALETRTTAQETQVAALLQAVPELTLRVHALEQQRGELAAAVERFAELMLRLAAVEERLAAVECLIMLGDAAIPTGTPIGVSCE